MAKVLTKSQVVSHLAEKVGLQKKAAAAVLEELVALATKEAKSSGQFVVPGLGKAVKANRKARMGRNPQTGEPIKIPAKTVVKFRLAKAFKDAVVPSKQHVVFPRGVATAPRGGCLWRRSHDGLGAAETAAGSQVSAMRGCSAQA
jgi:DNA-binding protein HU-beta